MRLGPLGTWELLIILVVVLLIFGPRRLPQMARGLGESVRAFRNEIRIMKGEIDGSEGEAPRHRRAHAESEHAADKAAEGTSA